MKTQLKKQQQKKKPHKEKPQTKQKKSQKTNIQRNFYQSVLWDHIMEIGENCVIFQQSVWNLSMLT